MDLGVWSENGSAIGSGFGEPGAAHSYQEFPGVAPPEIHLLKRIFIFKTLFWTFWPRVTRTRKKVIPFYKNSNQTPAKKFFLSHILSIEMKTNVKAETSLFLKPKDNACHWRSTPRKHFTKPPLKFKSLFSQPLKAMTTRYHKRNIDNGRGSCRFAPFRAVVRNVPCFSCSWGSRRQNSVSFSSFFLLKNRVARREQNAGERDARGKWLCEMV